MSYDEKLKNLFGLNPNKGSEILDDKKNYSKEFKNSNELNSNKDLEIIKNKNSFQKDFIDLNGLNSNKDSKVNSEINFSQDLLSISFMNNQGEKVTYELNLKDNSKVIDKVTEYCKLHNYSQTLQDKIIDMVEKKIGENVEALQKELEKF